MSPAVQFGICANEAPAGVFQLLATCAAEALATMPERIIPTRMAV